MAASEWHLGRNKISPPKSKGHELHKLVFQETDIGFLQMNEQATYVFQENSEK